ncbi:MAG: hypothetical protein EAY66_05080 [Sphingobacteriales bacterium]|nr:MAG: hypothetical protein EAY66_05080 [Sphingobacteriales bacterium]
MKKLLFIALLFCCTKINAQTYNYHSLVTTAGYDYFTIINDATSVTVIKNKQGKPMEILKPSDTKIEGDKVIYSFAGKEYQLSFMKNNLSIMNIDQGEFSKSYFLDSHVYNPKLVKPLK